MPKKFEPNLEEFKEYYIDKNYTREQMAKHYVVTITPIKSFIRKHQIKKPTYLLTQNRQSTSMERYGTTNPAQSEEIQERIKQTNLIKFGCEKSGSSPEVQAKRKQTMLSRYGVEYSGQSESLTKKRVDTMRAKYGFEYWTQIEHPKEGVEILNDKEKLVQFIGQQEDKTSYAIALELGYTNSNVEKKCKEFGISHLLSSADYVSKEEKEIKKILQEMGLEFSKNKKEIYPYEIDLYCEDLKFGIEFNGAYWHREEHKGKLYHQTKALMAQEKGIQLFQIFDYEWQDPRVKNRIIARIRNITQCNFHKVPARKCEVRVVENKKIKKNFLLENHLQGNDRSSISLGLYYKEQLVALMCFGKPRVNKQAEYELTRYASKEGMNVIGGASKLLTYFVRTKKCSTIVSYSDITKTTGNVYDKLGFKKQTTNAPRYVWCKTGSVLSRFQTQVKDEYKTMSQQGYYRVYDAGTITWMWTKGE